MKHRAIGIFDSGVGGLTVASTIHNLLPQESIVYVGDTARVPYGNRDVATITEFALNSVKILEKKNVKLLVVACNTMSAVCLDQIKRASSAPVIDVILPTVERVVESKPNIIGVIGTKATIASGKYESLIKHSLPKTTIHTLATPLLVPVIEEGMGNHAISTSIIRYYYDHLKAYSIDSLILGCTHYPLITQQIQQVAGSSVEIIDSAMPTAEQVYKYLTKHDRQLDNNAHFDLLFTDMSTHVIQAVNYLFPKRKNTKISQI